MFQNLPENTNIFDASLEIGIILFGAFILGFTLAWLLKPERKTYDVLEEIDDIKPSYVEKKKRVTPLIGIKEDMSLKMIEGIDTKVEKLLQKHGVHTFQDILKEDVVGLEAILLQGGEKYEIYMPTTWPDQARLAATGKWSELEEYQEILTQTKKETV